jgi:copper chaperone CopZ
MPGAKIIIRRADPETAQRIFSSFKNAGYLGIYIYVDEKELVAALEKLRKLGIRDVKISMDDTKANIEKENRQVEIEPISIASDKQTPEMPMLPIDVKPAIDHRLIQAQQEAKQIPVDQIVASKAEAKPQEIEEKPAGAREVVQVLEKKPTAAIEQARDKEKDKKTEQQGISEEKRAPRAKIQARLESISKESVDISNVISIITNRKTKTP